MYKKDCFAYKEKNGKKICSALTSMSCDNCKFYHTKAYYDLHVAPLKHKKSGGVI